MMALLCWLSIAGVVYAYAGYPLLMALLSRWSARPVRKAPYTASVSVLIAAHNEAARLPGKVRGLLAAQDAQLLTEVLIGSDGSTDDPAGALRALGDSRVRVLSFAQQRGKPAVLNDLMQQARGEIVVMMDARQAVDPGVFRALLANFADPRVGVVSGELVFRAPDQATDTAVGMDAYWRYEKFLRRSEARFRSVPGATGAIYAFRSALYLPIHHDTLLDDVAIPMQIVRQGFRCVFEPEAIVYDEPSRQLGQETARKRRTLAGNAQLVALMPWLISPCRNPIWFEFVSHKLLRLAVPFGMALALVSSAALLPHPLYATLFAAQLAFYLLAALGAWRARRGVRGGLLALPYLFVSLNLIAVLALADALTGRTRVQWSRKGAGA